MAGHLAEKANLETALIIQDLQLCTMQSAVIAEKIARCLLGQQEKNPFCAEIALDKAAQDKTEDLITEILVGQVFNKTDRKTWCKMRHKIMIIKRNWTHLL